MRTRIGDGIPPLVVEAILTSHDLLEELWIGLGIERRVSAESDDGHSHDGPFMVVSWEAKDLQYIQYDPQTPDINALVIVVLGQYLGSWEDGVYDICENKFAKQGEPSSVYPRNLANRNWYGVYFRRMP